MGAARRTVATAATVGVAEHGNSAVLVTLAPSGELLDRRRVDLTRGLPTHPYHHEGSWAVGRYLDSPWARPISLVEAVALVARVRAAGARGARECLEALASTVPMAIAGVAIRVCPQLPSMPSLPRWAAPSGHLGRPNTSSRRPRRSLPART